MSRKLLCVLLVLILALTAMTAVACDKTEDPVVLVPIDACEYYLESGESSYELSIGNDNTFTFKDGGTTLTGGYVVNAKLLTLTTTDGAVLTLNIGDKTAALTYNGQTYTLNLKVEYTVSFDTDGAGTIANQTVLNGSKATKPADLAKDGFKFLGWYDSDSFKTNFDFDQPITANTTVYANFVEIIGDEEYTVSFGYGDFADMDTINGQLFNIDMPTPTDKDGFTFGGWWISNTNDADELSYAWTEGLVFAENTTLYPLWVKATTGNKVEQQIVTLTETGFEWNGSSKATSGYLVEVTGPEGFTAIEETVNTNEYALDWANSLPGNYTVSVTGLASNEANNSDTTTLVYTNKGLARVSLFEIVDQYTLKFNAVANATEYFITVECNDPTHAAHENLSLGNRNTYDFSACDMPEDGVITFTITAHAEGYADSTAVYVLDRELDAVENLAVADELLTWNEVDFAAGYVLTVKGGDTDFTVKLDADTLEYDLQYFDLADYELTLVATAKAFHNSEAATLAYSKATLATPAELDAVGSDLEWTEVKGAVSYELNIDGTKLESDTNSVAWLEEIDLKDTDYVVKVRAVGENGEYSLWSEHVISADTNPSNLAYNANKFTWNGVIGADRYEVCLNGKVLGETANRSYDITLNKEGKNTLEVRAYNGDESFDWIQLAVNAYVVTFETEGSDVESLYLATGDDITLGETTLTGYTLDGWYDNDLKYEEDSFSGDANVALTARWTANEYTITYDAGDGSVANATATVTFDEEFTLDTATNKHGPSFVGWYSMVNGCGTRYTNELGEGNGEWTIDGNVTLHAYYANVLDYTLLNDGTLSVTKGDDIDLVNTVVVPSEVVGVNDIVLEVTVIDGYAFSQLSNVHAVDMPNTIELVEATAFNECYNLAAINVYPVEGNKIIKYSSEDGVLFDVSESANISIAAFPKAMEGTYTIPDYVASLPYALFSGCNNLTTIIVPTSVTKIANLAFSNCQNLTDIQFISDAEATLELGAELFNGSNALRTINLPAQVNELSRDTFDNRYITSITVDDDSAYYADHDGALYTAGCKELVYYPVRKTGDVNLPDTITSIGEEAFFNCELVTKIEIPASVTLIGKDAFKRTNLAEVTFLGAELPSDGLVIGDNAFNYLVTLKTVTFNEGSNVTEIGKSAFSSCVILSDLVLPDTLVEIGDFAFSRCTRLDDIVIPGTVTTIGASAFNGCTGLTTLTLEASEGDEQVLNIGNSAFNDCHNLVAVNIPATVKSVSGTAFTGCDKLTGITVDKDNPYLTDVNGVLFTRDITEILYYSPNRTGDYVLPEKVTTIGDKVFYENENLTKITIPGTITSIGLSAFEGCTALASVVFEAGEDELMLHNNIFKGCSALLAIDLTTRNVVAGDKTPTAGAEQLMDFYSISWFENCTNLRSVKLPDTITNIGNLMFSGCSSLAALDIPEGVTRIGTNAFKNCTSLTAITLHEGLTQLGHTAFMGCSALTSIELPSTLQQFVLRSGKYVWEYAVVSQNMFDGCTSLETVIFNATEEAFTFGEEVFSDCESLKSVTFQGDFVSVELGANYIFSGCSALESIKVPNVTAFADYMFKDCTSLTTVELSGPFLKLGTSAFEGCTSLTSVTLPDTLNAIGDAAFKNCSSLETFDMPTNLQNMAGFKPKYSIVFPAAVGKSAFEGCTSLKSVVFSDEGVYNEANGEGSYAVPFGLTLSDSAFKNCSSLTEMYLPKHLMPGKYSTSKLNPAIYSSITYGVTVFAGCTSLEAFAINPENEMFKVIDGVLYQTHSISGTKITTGTAPIIFACPVGKIGSVELDASAVAIATQAFRDCKFITDVTVADNSVMTDINSYAFQYCDNLASVEIASSVDFMGESVFRDCKKLSQVTFLKDAEGNTSLESMKGKVFENCLSLTEIYLPDSFEKFAGGYPFYGCDNLETIYIPNNFRHTASSYNKPTSFLTDVPAFKNFVLSNENENFALVGGVLYTKDLSVLLYCPDYLTDLVIADSYEYVDGQYIVNDYDGDYYKYVEAYYASAEDGYEGDLFMLVADHYELAEDGYVGDKFMLEYSYELADADYAGTKYMLVADEYVLIDGDYDGDKYQLVEDEYVLNTDETFAGDLYKLVAEHYAVATAEYDGDVYEQVNNYKPATADYTGDIFKFVKSHYAPAAVDYEGDTFKYVEATYEVVEYNYDGVAYKKVGDEYVVTQVAAVTAIYDYAFGSNINLVSVTLPNSLITIGSCAFTKSGLESITIPGSVEVISKEAFKACANLATITFLEGTEDLEFGTSSTSYVFGECSSLTSVVIPARVTELGASTFRSNSNLTSVTFEEGSRLTTMPGYVFYETAIESIVIPAGVTTLNASALNRAGNLKNVTFTPDANGEYLLKSVMANAFQDTTSLESIALPDSVTSLGNYVFKASGLKSFTMPSKVTTVPVNAFDACAALESVTLHGNIKTIGNYAFQNCHLLAGIDLPENLTSIGQSSFLGCISLLEVDVPSDVTTIGSSAFQGCTNLAEINLPDTLKTINSSAFNGTAITTIKLPSAVTVLNYGVFANCANLAKITIPDTITKIMGSTSYEGTFANCTSLKSISLPDTITTLGATSAYSSSKAFGVFQGCTSLTDVKLPSNYTSVGYSMFAGCTSLSNINLTLAVTKISKNAFDGCTSLTGFTLPSSITTIEDYAFKGCTALTEMQLPGALKTLGASPFMGCTGIEAFEVSANNTTFTSIDGALHNISGTKLMCYPAAKVGSYTLPEGMTTVPNDMFAGCTGLTEIALHDFVTSIGDRAFMGCTALESVVMSSSISSIGESAFAGCTSLKGIELPDRSITFKKNAFAGSGLESITLDAYNHSFSSYSNVFSDCTMLETVTIEGTPKYSITFNDGIFDGCISLTEVKFVDLDRDSKIYIRGTAFRDCISLTEFDWLPNLQVIEENAFMGSGITEVSLAFDDIEIGSSAFANCADLTRVTLNNFKKIGVAAFADCTSLEDVIIKGEGNYIYGRAFDNCTSLKMFDIPETCVTSGNPFTNCPLWTEFTGSTHTIVDGMIVNAALTALYAVPSGKTGDLVVSDAITYIGDYAFAGSALTSITIGANVAEIDECAFAGMTADQTIYMTDFTEAPSSWDDDWALGCEATIVWATADTDAPVA